METSVLRVVLEIDPAAEPVAGTVRGSPDMAQSFSGWTQLGHVLDGVIAEARERSGAGRHRTTRASTHLGDDSG